MLASRVSYCFGLAKTPGFVTTERIDSLFWLPSPQTAVGGSCYGGSCYAPRHEVCVVSQRCVLAFHGCATHTTPAPAAGDAAPATIGAKNSKAKPTRARWRGGFLPKPVVPRFERWVFVWFLFGGGEHTHAHVPHHICPYRWPPPVVLLRVAVPAGAIPLVAPLPPSRSICERTSMQFFVPEPSRRECMRSTPAEKFRTLWLTRWVSFSSFWTALWLWISDGDDDDDDAPRWRPSGDPSSPPLPGPVPLAAASLPRWSLKPTVVPFVAPLCGGSGRPMRSDSFCRAASNSSSASRMVCCCESALGVKVVLIDSCNRLFRERSASSCPSTDMSSFRAWMRLFLWSSDCWADRDRRASSDPPTLCIFSESFFIFIASRCSSRFRVWDWTHCAWSCLYRWFSSLRECVVWSSSVCRDR
mmetsp:Transcript_21586/g.45552  ORF Transcript_21586/g.45552 Transcript_21586/m.45552 type:complete len:415 (-) Transcript_21586:60-1304(-)